MTPARPRTKVRVGNARINGSDLRGLRTAWTNGNLVLFLGAGLSMPYGLPSWKNLVLELLFEQTEHTRRLGDVWPHYRRALAAWMTDYFDYSPLVLARMVERELRASSRSRGLSPFLARLRRHIYADYHRPGTRTALDAVADLAAAGDDRVRAIVTFNFDDLLERELRRRGVRHHVVASSDRMTGRGLRVVHAHGFIPAHGPVHRDSLVFTEPDYHRLTESTFHWALSEVVEHLRKSTVLFIGLSMSDPSLRRLLDACRNCDIPPHWQIQKRHEVHDHELDAVMKDVERRARDHSSLLGVGFDETKRPDELADSIRAALLQADTYDREVFESMGVKTIWLDDFDDIQHVVDAIRSGPR